jgi:hypothetical protein
LPFRESSSKVALENLGDAIGIGDQETQLGLILPGARREVSANFRD